MRTQPGSQSGFTLVELLVAMSLFAIISTAFYQLMISTRNGSETTRNIVGVSEQSRLAFNRMVRDTREANELLNATTTSFTIWTDFDSDNVQDGLPSDETGSYEVVRYSWSSVARTITLTADPGAAAPVSEVLLRGVDCVERVNNSCVHPVFTFMSSRLEYDSDGDGITSVEEMEAAAGFGNGNSVPPVPTGDELDLVDLVAFSIRVSQGDGEATMYSEAQLRNQR